MGRNEDGGWGAMTPQAAAEFLRSGRLPERSFSDTLRELYPGEDLQERLTACFARGEDALGVESASRKVRNWLSGRHAPTDREDIFRAAFALGLTEGQAGILLGRCTDCGIHYRDGRDVIYAWFLRTGRSFEEAREFYASLPKPEKPAAAPNASGASHITHELQACFQRVRNTRELRECYIAKLPLFGSLHLRAYAYFDKYMSVLTSPSGDEQDYSLEAVTELYLGMNMPMGRDRSGYTAAQKLIKHGWPNATAIKMIKARERDVPRKLLLILYVVTENVLDTGYTESDEAYISPEERFEDHWWTLNAILSDCGMPTLDPRDPTDWLVLYSLRADSDSMSERMSAVIKNLYGE